MSFDHIMNVTGPDDLHRHVAPKFVMLFGELAKCATYDPPAKSKAGRDNAVRPDSHR